MLTILPPEQMVRLLEGVVGERRGLEFKESFQWVMPENQITEIQAKTIKTLLGFANTPQGGTLIIGVTDNGASQHDFTGVTAEAKATYQDTEAIARQLDGFASSPLDYEIGIGDYQGNEYIVFAVSEFNIDPVQCAKDLKVHNKIMLQKHALYTRSSKSQPATIQATPIELRSVITMAEERDESFIKRFSNGQPAVVEPTDITRYEAQDEDLL